MRILVPAILGALTLATAAAAQDRWMALPHPPAMPEAASTGKAPVNGIEMYFATYGTAVEGRDPILLIHGGLGHADIWAHQVADLAQDHLVIVADSRGHGRSTRTAEAYGYDLMASDLVALLDFLKVERVDLVGWSDGGIIGLAIAMKHPARLDRLFAQAANVTVEGVDPAVATNATFGNYITRMGEDYARMSPTPGEFEAFVAQISNMWATQPNWPDADLVKITTPTVVVLGDHDEAITRAHTDHMATVIPGATEVILPETSHFAMLQNPEGYTAAIRAFFD